MYSVTSCGRRHDDAARTNTASSQMCKWSSITCRQLQYLTLNMVMIWHPTSLSITFKPVDLSWNKIHQNTPYKVIIYVRLVMFHRSYVMHHVSDSRLDDMTRCQLLYLSFINIPFGWSLRIRLYNFPSYYSRC